MTFSAVSRKLLHACFRHGNIPKTYGRVMPYKLPFLTTGPHKTINAAFFTSRGKVHSTWVDIYTRNRVQMGRHWKRTVATLQVKELDLTIFMTGYNQRHGWMGYNSINLCSCSSIYYSPLISVSLFPTIQARFSHHNCHCFPAVYWLSVLFQCRKPWSPRWRRIPPF